MSLPAIDDIQHIWRLLPRIEAPDVDSALNACGKDLSSPKRAELLEQLDTAFTDYFRKRLWQLWAAKAPAARTANQLGRIANAADKLIRLLGAQDGPESMPELYFAILAREAEAHGENIGGYAGLPPIDFPEPSDRGRKALRKWYQGKTRLRQCLDGLTLLKTLLHAAHAYERKKVTPGTARNRRDGDEAMPELFNNLHGIWFDTFDESPGAGWNAHRNEAAGPYVSFVVSLFSSLHAKLHEEIRGEYPELEKNLKLTANAVRARFRRSVGSRDSRLASRLARASMAKSG